MSLVSLSKAEKSFITIGFKKSPPQRTDGRNLTDYRSMALETGVAPLANGSARLCIGRNINDNGGGTEVLAATKVEVESISVDESTQGRDGGRFVVTVSCSPAAYPHLTQTALEDLQYDLTAILDTTLTHPSLHPKNLTIIPRKKSWLLHLDLLILSDAGNTLDALFMAARAALWDTKIPRTRSIEYKVPNHKSQNESILAGANATFHGDDMDVDAVAPSGFDTRAHISRATDFELPDYWDEGENLDGRQKWPICVTLNVVSPIHFLDATLHEEAAVSLRLLLIFSFPHSAPSTTPMLQGMRTLGTGDISPSQIREFVEVGQKYALDLCTAINAKLMNEEVRRTQKAQEIFTSSRR